jgi:hypothetical protein
MPDNYGKNTDAHPQYEIIIDLLQKNSYANEPQYYLIRTLPALYNTLELLRRKSGLELHRFIMKSFILRNNVMTRHVCCPMTSTHSTVNKYFRYAQQRVHCTTLCY